MAEQKNTTPQIFVAEASYKAVKKYRAAAAKERTAITNTPNTLWYLFGFNPDTLVGCAGLMVMPRANRARIKGIFVEPEYRNRGLGRAIVKRLVRQTRRQGLDVEAYAHNEAFYLEEGFVQIGRNANGVARFLRVKEKKDQSVIEACADTKNPEPEPPVLQIKHIDDFITCHKCKASLFSVDSVLYKGAQVEIKATCACGETTVTAYTGEQEEPFE